MSLKKPIGAALHVDWVLSSESNAHVATDRAWFTEFYECTSHDECRPEVAGIGIVELEVFVGKFRGPKILTLHDVLFVPTAVCNIVSSDLILTTPGYTITTSERQTTLKWEGTTIALLDSPVLPRFRLPGMTEHQTSLRPDTKASDVAVR
jgi:hypothetical protein